jgi:hypothetical protein
MSNIGILLKVVSARTISLSCTSKEYNKEIVEGVMVVYDVGTWERFPGLMTLAA